MAKFSFVFLATLALLCAQAPAQGNSQQPAEQNSSASQNQQATPDQSQSAQPSKDPRAADQGGPTEQPNPQIVPPAGPQKGINPDAAQPGGEQREGASQSQEIAPASNADRELAQNIDKALKNEPTLSNAQVQVGIENNTITLSGTVPSGKDRTTATRIATSFGGDRKVVDQLTVVGRKEPGRESTGQPGR
jgi:hypothetical protein